MTSKFGCICKVCDVTTIVIEGSSTFKCRACSLTQKAIIVDSSKEKKKSRKPFKFDGISLDSSLVEDLDYGDTTKIVGSDLDI